MSASNEGQLHGEHPCPCLVLCSHRLELSSGIHEGSDRKKCYDESPEQNRRFYHSGNPSLTPTSVSTLTSMLSPSPGSHEYFYVHSSFFLRSRAVFDRVMCNSLACGPVLRRSGHMKELITDLLHKYTDVGASTPAFSIGLG